MKTPKPSHTPSYIDEAELGVSMADIPKRDPRKDPQAGDVLVMSDGSALRVISREIRGRGRYKYLGNAQHYLWYGLDGAGLITPISVSEFRKWARGAEIINSWRCTWCHAPSHEPAPDERVVCNGCGIMGCERGVPKR